MYIEISAKRLREIKIFAKTLSSYIPILLIGISIIIGISFYLK